MSSVRRRAAGLSVVVLVAAVGIVAWSALRGDGDAGDGVRTGVATKGPITSRVLAQGKVRARTQVEVTSEIAGRIATVDVEVGDTVKVGDLLFTIDEEQLRNGVDQLRSGVSGAEAMVERARLALAEAERSVVRDDGLLQRKVIPEEQVRAGRARVDLARVDVQQSSAALERARLDLSRARDSLRRARVLSPIEGTVVAVGVEKGQVVTPSTGLSATDVGGLGLGMATGGPGAPVILADLRELLVKLDVDELDVGQLRAGQSTLVTAQGIKDWAFEGVVERVGLMGREQAGAVLFAVEVVVQRTTRPRTTARTADADGADAGPAEVEGDPIPAAADLLRPGMSAQAEIDVLHLDDAVVVAVSAVLEGGGSDGDSPDRVYVAEEADGALVARERVVKLGPAEDDRIAILAGVAAGERVIEGPFRVLKALEDGDRVRELPLDDADKASDQAKDGEAKK